MKNVMRLWAISAIIAMILVMTVSGFLVTGQSEGLSGGTRVCADSGTIDEVRFLSSTSLICPETEGWLVVSVPEFKDATSACIYFAFEDLEDGCHEFPILGEDISIEVTETQNGEKTFSTEVGA